MNDIVLTNQIPLFFSILTTPFSSTEGFLGGIPGYAHRANKLQKLAMADGSSLPIASAAAQICGSRACKVEDGSSVYPCANSACCKFMNVACSTIIRARHNLDYPASRGGAGDEALVEESEIPFVVCKKDCYNKHLENLRALGRKQVGKELFARLHRAM